MSDYGRYAITLPVLEQIPSGEICLNRASVMAEDLESAVDLRQSLGRPRADWSDFGQEPFAMQIASHLDRDRA